MPLPTATTAPPPVTGGGGGGGGGTIPITAAGLQFTPRSLVTRAGASTSIVMNNQDTRVPHNVSISGLGTSATCAGPCSATLSFIAPAPGNYTFFCTVHPFMTGTLTVR